MCLTDSFCFSQPTSAGACMEVPTTSRVMEVRIARTQPTALTAVASTPPPQPPAECPLSDSSSCRGTQVWPSGVPGTPCLSFTCVTEVFTRHVLTSTPAKRSSREESSGCEPAVVGGQRAEHLGDGRGLGGLLNDIQAQRCHRCADTSAHAGREYVPGSGLFPVFSLVFSNDAL